jgi:hypothetical protein
VDAFLVEVMFVDNFDENNIVLRESCLDLPLNLAVIRRISCRNYIPGRGIDRYSSPQLLVGWG